jgi:hypothetical protein
MTRIRAAVVALVAFAALLFASGTAHAAVNDAVIKNQSFSYTTLTVCKSLVSDTKCGATVGYLSPGQNSQSKYGWPDTDAIYCGQGWWCKIDSNTFRGSGTGWNSRLIKVSGCGGCTIYVYLYPDHG